MLENGFTYKLILDEDGRIASWGLNPQGEEVVSRELDAIPALDKFVEEHPDFSPFGAKASLSLTGYDPEALLLKVLEDGAGLGPVAAVGTGAFCESGSGRVRPAKCFFDV